MTMDQLEGNEPMHENYGTELGEEIDEVTSFYISITFNSHIDVLLGW